MSKTSSCHKFENKIEFQYDDIPFVYHHQYTNKLEITMSLQTLAFIQTVDNICTGKRIPETEEEFVFLSHYHYTSELLNGSFSHDSMVLFWEEEGEGEYGDRKNTRKKLIKTLDLSFHKLYRKMAESFQKVQLVFLEIFPGIDKNVYVYTVPSVKALVELYVRKVTTMQKSLFSDEVIDVLEEEEEE